MHFSIPDTHEIYTENSATTYTGYNIYINGNFHCCLRYKQLHALHVQLQQQLRRLCAETNIQLPAFPPKRLLPLTTSQLENRRRNLEEYLQYLGQDARIAKIEFLQNFLLNAQLETAERLAIEQNEEDIRTMTVKLEVVLMNGEKIKLDNFRISCNSSALLRQACDFLRLPKHLVPYFCLFLARNEAKNTQMHLRLLRRLMDFESPYLSKRVQARPCQILLRKCYWDPSFDLHLMQDHNAALNLLYIQTVGDVERDWIITTPEIRQKLRTLEDHRLKREYIEMARQLPLYGCLQFAESTVDYPESDTIAIISIGNKELSLRTTKGPKIYETKFRVTRMRCWRVTAIHNTQSDSLNDINEMTLTVPPVPTNLQLSFEYLMSKQVLRWITISSSQAMLMSVCLQSMVDELLLSKSGVELLTTTAGNCSSLSQSRSGNLIPYSSLTPTISNEPLSGTSTSTNSSTSASSSPTPPVKFIAQQQRRTKHNPKILTAANYAAVFFRNAQDESVQNEAFEGIGDDDL